MNYPTMQNPLPERLDTPFNRVAWARQVERFWRPRALTAAAGTESVSWRKWRRARVDLVLAKVQFDARQKPRPHLR